MKKIYLILAAVFLLQLSCTAAERTLTLELQYSMAENGESSLEISGETGLGGGINVNLLILPLGADRAEITPQNPPVYAFSVQTEEEGAYAQTIGISQSLKAGGYTVWAGSGGQMVSRDFIHTQLEVTKLVLQQINSAATQELLLRVMQDNLTALGIVERDFSPAAEVISAILLRFRPQGGYGVSAFFERYRYAYAVGQFGLGADVRQVLSVYEGLLGIDLRKDYLSFNQAVRQEVDRQLAAADLTVREFKELYPELLLLSRVRASENYSVLQSVISQNAEALNLSFDKYNQLSERNRGKAYMDLFAQRHTIDSYQKIRTAFDACVSALLPDNSGGGGGGGSNSKPSGPAIGGESGAIPTPPPQEAVFSDLERHWSRETVEALFRKGIVKGFENGSFRPEQPVTRAEFVQLIVSAFPEEAEAGPVFEDVDKDAWYYAAVTSAASRGLVNGSGGKFQPEQFISRQDAAVIMARLVRSGEGTSAARFADDDDIADYARKAVYGLTEMGLLQGDGGWFSPLSDTTRAQAATMISNLLQQTGGK